MLGQRAPFRINIHQVTMIGVGISEIDVMSPELVPAHAPLVFSNLEAVCAEVPARRMNALSSQNIAAVECGLF